MDGDGRINEILIDPEGDVCDYSINVVIMNRPLLIDLIKDALSRNYTSLGRDIFQRNINSLKIYGLSLIHISGSMGRFSRGGYSRGGKRTA